MSNERPHVVEGLVHHAAALACAELAPVNVEVGVDVTSVHEVAASVERFGAAYLDRIFTAREVSDCRGDNEGGKLSAESLAARFAAKEALLKVLRPTGARPPWPMLEVASRPDGGCVAVLHGSARVLADERAIDELALSLSHDGDHAVAVVIATRTPAADREQSKPESEQ